MKYSININQAGIADAGFADKTDLVDWALIDYIYAWQNNPAATRVGSLVWISYKHLISEMPLLGLKTKQAVSARMSKLKALSLIAVEYDSDKRLYAGLTGAAHSASVFRASRPPNVAGVHENGQGVHEDGQGGVHEDGHSAVNQFSAVHQEQSDKTLVGPKAADDPAFDAFWSAYPLHKGKVEAMKAWRKHGGEKVLPTIFADIEARIAAGDWQLDRKEFIPRAATYLNGERWNDEIINRRGKPHETSGHIDRPRCPADRLRAIVAAREAQREADDSIVGGDAPDLRPPVRGEFWDYAE